MLAVTPLTPRVPILPAPRRSGGIGRRAWLRAMWAKARGSSSLLSDTRNPKAFRAAGFLASAGGCAIPCGSQPEQPIIAANDPAVSRSCSSETRLERSNVVVIDACPSRCDTTFTGTPCDNAGVAGEWRGPWTPNGGEAQPASLPRERPREPIRREALPDLVREDQIQ